MQDEGFDMPDVDYPDADDAEGAAEDGADVKDEEGEVAAAEQSGGFAPAAAKEMTKSGAEKLSEVDDWRAMRDAAAADAAEMEEETSAEEKVKAEDGAASAAGGAVGLPLEEDGSLNMFWIDAYEDNSKPGRIYMFGKVRTGDGKGGTAFSSCCLQIDNVQRQVYILPRAKLLDPEVRWQIEDAGWASAPARTTGAACCNAAARTQSRRARKVAAVVSRRGGPGRGCWESLSSFQNGLTRGERMPFL